VFFTHAAPQRTPKNEMMEEPSKYGTNLRKISNVALDYNKHVGGCGLSDYYGEDKEALQENILLAP
jgi:hypothetical protein